MSEVSEVVTERRRLRFVFGARSGATPESGVQEYWDGDIAWVTPEDLGSLNGMRVTSTRRQLTEEGYRSCATSLAPVGSIVLSKRAPIGQVAVLGIEAACNQGCFLLSKKGLADERYFFYALLHLRPLLEILGRGSTFMELSTDDLRSVRLPYPSQEVQRQVANFLDRETGRIDGLTAEKERMLALLDEKRGALVSRLVTRGLEQQIALRPSGQEWLGEIPEHWGLQPIKHLADVGNGSTPSVENVDYWAENGLPWLNSSVVNEEVVRSPSRFVTPRALRECHLPVIQPPAVLVGITGQGKTRGMASVLAIEATINQHLAYLKPKDDRIVPEYLRAVLAQGYAFLRSDSDGAGSTKGAITCEQLANTKIPVPPRSEQIAICAYLERCRQRDEPLRTGIAASISLLRERRTALISAAVTGEIPLEELVA